MEVGRPACRNLDFINQVKLSEKQWYTGCGPERMQDFRSIISKKTRDRIEKVVCIIAYKNAFPMQDDTKIVNFDEGVLILSPFF